MKQQKFMTRIIFALSLATMIAVPTASLRAQSSDEPTTARDATQGGGILDVLEQIKLAQAQALEGSWLLTISPAVPPGVPQPPSFPGNVSFSRGGVAFGADPRSPSSRQFGSWVHQGGNEFAATLREDLYDQAGNFTGTIKVRKRIIVTGKDEYVGVSNREESNAAGGLISSRCATVKAQRIRVEPLAPQCQSITPPQ